MKKKCDIETMCVHAGIEREKFGSVTPPIYQTSTFEFNSAEEGAAFFGGDKKGYIYTRMGNPTIEAMENCVAELEGGVKSLGCASGMAAVSSVFTGLLKSGDHVICSSAVYGPTSTFLKSIMSKFGVETTFVNTSDLNKTEKAIKKNTTVIYIETPGNPTLDITDIHETSKLAKGINATLVVDNTFMSPILQNPLKQGADIVLHSMTKYLNGHADVVAGIIVFKNEERYKHFRSVLNHTGGVIDPFNSFLVHRGIKTLSMRMSRHCENGLKVAEYLERHPKVEWVRYPGLKSHPHYQTAVKQQKGPGGMISFELKGGIEAGRKMMNSAKLCKLAVSLGGVESLIQHPASMTHLTMGKEARLNAGITDGLVRVSVGVENCDEIIEDLDNAMK